MPFFRLTLFLFCFLFAITINAQKVNFKNYSIANGLPQSDVTDAVQDAVGYIWFATQGGGIARFDGNDFEVFSQEYGLLSNFVNSFYIHKDSLFIGTNNGLSIKTKNKITNFKTPKINKLIWLDKKLYLATNQGVYQFKKEYVTPIQIDLKIDLSNVLDIQYKNYFYWIKTSNKIWKSTTLNTKSKIKASSLKEFEANFNEQKLIINNLEIDNSIKLITHKTFTDRQQNTWLLTNENGVYKSASSNFKHFNTIENQAIKEITAVHQKNNSIWFTDTNRNLFTIDSLGIRFVRKNNFKTTAIKSDSDDNLWFGSQNKGVYIFRKSNDSLNFSGFDIERLHSENGLSTNNIQNIIIENNTVWLVSEKIGILKLAYNFQQNFVESISVFNQNNGLKNQLITTSLLHNNKIWYGTLQGDIGFIANNTVTHYSRFLNKNTTISSLSFSADYLYIGTLGNGIWKTTIPKLNSPKPIKGEFLSSKNSYQLMVDAKNQLWIGSEKGVDKIEFQNNKISKSTHYNANDGFIGIETTKNTSLEDQFGNLWFGTKNGITRYTPNENKKTLIKPTIHFENIEVSNQSIDSIQKQFKNAVLQLSPAQNNISFSFKTVDINQPKRVEYQYTLNETKSSWTSNNSINFANLTSGNYTFSVRSRNASKFESEPTVFTFFIDKPLYQKTWFIAGIIALVILIFFLIIFSFFRRKQLKNQQKIEKLTLENHLITLEQKALQLQMNPHFIFNVLNGIKAFGNNGNTKELNITISQFATLLRSLLQNSRKEEINLSEEIETLKNYLDLEQKMNGNFEYTITTEVDNIATEEILIPPMLVQPFVENSIKHGFKNVNGRVSIHFRTKNNHLVCTIIDNGIGIEQSKKAKAASKHTSIALKVTKERIENLSKTSTLEIKELAKNSYVIGTKVEFKIPLKTDY
ncbi:sensor histidine kinase [Polaribacter uvawellassae]|uniref:sensor histidine kinase n=1 Tax=Polaribacter uvawellassae TaxID=3133495 RepID=UPI00321C33CB